MIKVPGLDQVLMPINQAKGLQNAHYTDHTVFEKEKRRVMFGNWCGVGFGKDVPNPGDVKPIEFLGVPLLIVRDQDGELRVFENICRHRGMILVDEQKNFRGPIRCPYHSWCYSLKGDLCATPHVGGAGKNTHKDIDPAKLSLNAVRSYIWQDVIFINISADATPFETHHAHLLERWKEFDQLMFHGGEASSFKLHIKANWKLAVENYCEAYHLPWIHPGLNSYSRMEDHYPIEMEDRYSGQGSLVYRQIKNCDGLYFPDFLNLNEKWNRGSEYIAIYPNLLMGAHRDHFFSILLEPVDMQNTIEHVEIYYPNEIINSQQYLNLSLENAKLWKTIFEEDIFCCRRYATRSPC